jgi:hypothetical protein
LDEAETSHREKQLKSRIAKWGFDIKNIKGHTMVHMARARLKRKREDGKDSLFLVNNRQVPDRNINRYLKRNKISEESLLSMASPINGTIVLYAEAEDTNPLEQRLFPPFVSPRLVLDHYV